MELQYSMLSGSNYKKYSNSWLLDRFFKYGSIDKALWEENSLIPFSYMSYYRILSEAGVVRSQGRQTSFTEALHFFRIMQSEPGMPLESIYKKLPTSFKTSLRTLHRIYNKLENAIPGRPATALIISYRENPEMVLVGSEVSGNKLYGKHTGSTSIPMTFSHVNDSKEEAILRVLQQEVFTTEAVQGKFSDTKFRGLLLNDLSLSHFVYRILDVDIRCFRLFIPQKFSEFTSYKLSDHNFIHLSDIVKNDVNFRYGVKDILQKVLNIEEVDSKEFLSPLNIDLLMGD